MRPASLSSIVRHCDALLRPAKFNDYDGAVNGLQMENSGKVVKIAAAVDASLATIKLAIAAEANLLIVHHGLFWGPTVPWTGHRHAMLKLLIENDLAVYSSHLPLDAHPRLGNNVLFCDALGFKNLRPFWFNRGHYLGLQTRTSIGRAAIAEKMTRVLGCTPIILPGGPAICRRIGVVTGGAGDHVKTAAAEGVDTFITGEGQHHTFALAEELGVNVFYGGHYATETFGVKALAETLSKKFKVPWVFIDHPTGL